MERKIANLSDHYIVCGAGELGKHVILELIKTEKKFVVIDKDEETIKKLPDYDQLLYLQGEASEEAILIKCGIEKAKGGEIYHLAGNEVLQVKEIVRIISWILGRKVPRLPLPLLPALKEPILLFLFILHHLEFIREVSFEIFESSAFKIRNLGFRFFDFKQITSFFYFLLTQLH